MAIKDELPDDLVAFLKTDRLLRYDPSTCEIGVFTLRALDEVREIELAISAENGDAVSIMHGLDLLRSCEEYDPHGMLVYIPSLRKYGSYDSEKQCLVTYRGMSWSDLLANPSRYINAGWLEDDEIAEETFNESGADRIVEVCSAANATEAGFLADALTEKGFRANVVGDTLGAAAGLLPLGESTAPRIWVREGDSGRAREIVNEVNNRRRASGQFPARDDDDVEFPCQECGIRLTFPATSRGFVETCPACGNYVDVPEVRQGSLLGDAIDADTVIAEDPPAKPPPAVDTAAPAVPDAAIPPRALPEISASNKRTTAQLWIEVIAVLFLAYVPYLFSSIVSVSGWLPRLPSDPLAYHMLTLVISSLQEVLPLLVIISLSHDSWRSFGIVRPKWIADIAIALAILMVRSVAYSFELRLLPISVLDGWKLAHVTHRDRPQGITMIFSLIAFCAISAFAQELVMRAYLITRLQRLLQSKWLPVVITTALFASYHVYEGPLGSISAATSGLVYGIAFCWCRRLWPLCIAHAGHNVLVYLGW